MTTDYITSEHQLDQLCKQYALDILGDAKSYDPENWLEYARDNAHDLAHDWADGCQHVIYHYNALKICTHCDISRGEQFLEDVGQSYTNINQLASAIVYGEIYSRTLEHLENEIDYLEDVFAAAEV